jgi:L-ascorbate metabolism protein UlaG (beta-lactamase superfamily)
MLKYTTSFNRTIMQIQFHGHSCFTIKEGNFTLVTDPFEGAKFDRANAITLSQPTSQFKAPTPEAKLFNWPGEYETSGTYLMGISSFHNTKESEKQEENTIFKIECNGLRLCHLGRLGTKPTPEQLEQIGDVDVLFIPISGEGSIDAKKAKEVIEQIEPRLMIPMLYTEDTLAAFLKEMGAVSAERLDTLSVKRSELPEEMSKVVVLRAV